MWSTVVHSEVTIKDAAACLTSYAIIGDSTTIAPVSGAYSSAAQEVVTW